MDHISHALVYFHDKLFTSKPFIVRTIQDIKANKKDEHHIQPKDASDFNPKKTYFAKWTCDITCTENHTHFGYYPCFIVLYGESKEHVKQILSEKKSRVKIPKIVKDLGATTTSSESENTEKNNVKIDNKTSKTVKQGVLKARTQSVLSKLSKNYKITPFKDSDDENSSIVINANNKTSKVKVKSCQFVQVTEETKEKSDNYNETDQESLCISHLAVAELENENSTDGSEGKEQQEQERNQHNNDQQVDEVIINNQKQVDKDAQKEVEENVNEQDDDLIRQLQAVEGTSVSQVESLSDYIIRCIQFYKALDGYGHEEYEKRYKAPPGEKYKIYLGENITIDPLQWNLLYTLPHPLFLNKLIEHIWPDYDLGNRALDKNKVTVHLPGRSPVKTIQPNLLRLLISLYTDFLERQRQLTTLERAMALRNTTRLLTKKISNIKGKLKKQNQSSPAKKKLRYSD